MSETKQKQITLIGLRVDNYRILKSVLLTPDVLSQRVTRVTGDIGQGKSTLLDALKIGLNGTDAIAKKDGLEKGFVAEVQLMDGEHKLFMGAKVTEYQRGENKGEPKFETYLYEKDPDGKPFQPIIDGRAATAADYSKMLTTELVFNMPMLFSSNATEHRKLIEKLFADELSKLGVASVVEKINSSRAVRDNRRSICDANGSFLDSFKEEGWGLEDLQALSSVDVKTLSEKITALEVEKGVAKTSVEDKNKLAESKAQEERTAQLQKIKDDAAKVVGKIRVVTEKLKSAHEKSSSEWSEKFTKLNKCKSRISYLFSEFVDDEFLLEHEKENLKEIVRIAYDRFLKDEKNLVPEIAPVLPILIQIDEMGIPVIPENPDKAYSELIAERDNLKIKYQELNATPLSFAKIELGDTTEIDEKIKKATLTRDAGLTTNRIYERFGQWNNWMEAKAEYEGYVNELRRLYAGINTGVEGLVITPIESGKSVEIWLQYDGAYNPEFFGNDKRELRWLFDYSETQRAMIGVMLQAARLDLKEKCLRLCVLDSVPLTRLGVEVMTKICDEKDVQLITSYTDDHYDLENLEDNEIVVENGCVFFGVKNASTNS